ncbi:alpha/beta hydrolase [Aeromicrobium phragmitis]|uniref:Alpha/beta hydrolase n=1 Tax=Aeromicrobium phragmitis TaxID=2478914 RepID=A0A3L8PRU1_9ACTN|nr:alpha/beta hydrolase [Aeromicrobium phragmitis]RLV56672.1 alpha/beta hydrolase [Aeromicrobium phragmitis]
MRSTGTPPRRSTRRVAAVVAGVLTLVILATQLIALLPPHWWGPALDVPWLQYAIIVLGVGRDELGIWLVLLAILALVLAVRAVRAAASAARRVLTLGAAVALLASAATAGTLVTAAADEGAGVWPFAPTVPFMSNLEGPDATVTVSELNDEELRADLYLPGADGPHPVVVFVHGGGFDGGDKGPSPYHRYLADRGYAVVDVQYRLARPGRPTWDLAVNDVGCALTWVTRHAGEYALDARRVALFGQSAGGNLAYNAGYLASSGDLDPSCGSADELPHVRAVLGSYPAVDLTDTRTVFGRRLSAGYIGGSPQEYPERYAFTHPLTHASPSSPPTLVVQGTRDHLVLPGPAERFVREIRQLEIPTRYVPLPASEHGAGDFGGTATWGTRTTRAVVVQWLNAHVRE